MVDNLDMDRLGFRLFYYLFWLTFAYFWPFLSQDLLAYVLK